MLNKDQEHAGSRLIESVAIDLRRVLEQARHDLDEFEKYVDSWDDAVAKVKNGSMSAEEFGENYVVLRAMEMVDSTAHVHSGSGRASHLRTCRQRLLQLAYIGRDR